MRGPFPAGHVASFFSSETDRVQTVVDFIRDGIACGDTCLIVATPEHRDVIRTQLCQRSIDVPALTARYQYIELDTRTLLSQFMNGSRCDRPRFHALLDTLMRQAASRGQPVRAHSETANVLIQDGLPDTAMELEELWNEFSREHRFTLLCGYSTAAIDTTRNPGRLTELIRALHSHEV
ncbi:MEDS domain-containing protein [Povalibacter sp.]|uniref:MEDS domain-containing protein n=1 Tax=Povalibacter sp. TaxID=1962978 RepID=UPI002F3FE918